MLFELKPIFLLLLLTILTDKSFSKKHVWIRKFIMCDPNYNYPIKFKAFIKIKGESQFVNMTSEVNTPLGLDQSMNATFEYSSTGEGYMSLFKLTRSDLCDFFNKDLGPFWFELQKQIGVPTGQCPLPVGRYNLRNYELPYKKLRLPLPTGFVRSFINMIDLKTREIVTCIFNIVEITSE